MLSAGRLALVLGLAATLVTAEPWTPQFDLFTTGNNNNGWTSNVATLGSRECGAVAGRVLGGWGYTASGHYLEKRYTGLPKHSSVLITLTYFHFRSWENELAQVLVDDQVEWAERYSIQDSNYYANCGGRAFQKVVDIFLPAHTATTILLRAQAQLNSGAANEAFGIAKVKVVPLNVTAVAAGQQVTPFATPMSMAAAWYGYNTRVASCGVLGGPNGFIPQVLVSEGVGGGLAALNTTVTGLPTHNALRIQAKFIFTHKDQATTGKLVVDSVLAWSSLSRDGDLRPPPCGYRGNTVDVTIPHTAATAAFSFDVTGAYSFQTALGVLAVADLVITPETLGQAPWSNATSDFSVGPDGWLTTLVGQPQVFTKCPFVGPVLGGPRIAAAGDVLSKQYTGLPSHSYLLVSMTYVLFGNWNTQRVYVEADGITRFTSSRHVSELTYQGNGCFIRVLKEPLDFLIAHSTPNVFLKATSDSVVQSQSYGIRDVRVTPILIPPVIQTITAGEFAQWSGYGIATRACGARPLVLISKGIDGLQSRLTRTFTGLPSHNALQVNLDVIYTHTSGTGILSVLVDGQEVWSALHTGAAAAGGCGAAANLAVVAFTATHSAATAKVEVVFRLGRGLGDPALGNFAIDAVSVGPVSAGSGPWRVGPSDFSAGTDGFLVSGTVVQTTRCAETGFILGGHQVAGRNTLISKTYTGIPAHSVLLVTMRLAFLGSWENEQVTVTADGAQVYAVTKGPTDGVYSTSCAIRLDVDQVAFVLASHSTPTLRLEIRSSLNQIPLNEAFGVGEVTVTPLNSSINLPIGSGAAVYAAGNPYANFAAANDYGGFQGLAIAPITCAARFTTPLALASTGLNGADPTVTKSFTNLPLAHNNLRLRARLLLSQVSGTAEVLVRVDGNVIWTASETLAGQGPACGAAIKSRDIDIYIGHSGATARIEFQLVGAYAQVNGNLGVLVLGDVRLGALTLGRAPWRPVVEGFRTGPNNWLAAVTGVQLSQCNEAGFVLGGFGVLGKTNSVSKTFTGLPAHDSVIVALDLALFGNYEPNDLISVTVDGTEVFSSSYDPNAFAWAPNCRARFLQEQIAVVVAHTASEVAVAVRGTFNGAVTDEAWGLQTSEIVPINATSPNAGQSVTVLPPGPTYQQPITASALATFDGVASLQPCSGNSFAVSGIRGAAANFGTVFSKIPLHNNLRIRFRLFFLQAQGTVTVTASVAGTAVWSATVDRADPAWGCPSQGVDAEFFVAHTADFASLSFSASGGFDALTAKGLYAINRLFVEPVFLGTAPYVANAVSDFRVGPDNFLTTGEKTQVSFCSSYGASGWALGGRGILGRTARISKTWTGLGAHNGLLITFQVAYIGSWENHVARASVDGVEFWSYTVKNADQLYDPSCRYNQQVQSVAVLAPAHTARSAAFLFAADLNEANTNEAVAIFDVTVAPIVNPLPPSGSGLGPWYAGPVDFSLPAVDNWKGLNVAYLNCSGFRGDAMRSSGLMGADAAVSKRIQRLGLHNTLKVEFTFIYTSQAGSVNAAFSVDAVTYWTAQRTTIGAIGTGCSAALLHEDVTLYIAHAPGNALLEFDLTGAFGLVDPNLGVFAVANLIITRLTLGSAPWQPRASNFALGPDGWLTSGETHTSLCGSLGYILGGAKVTGRSDTLTKTFTQLPTHEGLIITLDYVYIGTWDQEIGRVLVDNNVEWSESHFWEEGVYDVACFKSRVLAKPVSLLVRHNASSVMVQIDALINSQDESFGIRNFDIALVPSFDARIGTGVGPYVAGPANFAAGFDNWQGLNISSVTCPGVGAVLSSVGIMGARPTVTKRFTRLPAHNTLRVQMKVLLTHQAARSQLKLSIDSEVPVDEAVTGAGLPGCSAATDVFAIDTYVLHSANAATLELSLDGLFGKANGAFGVFALSDVIVTPLSLGSEPYSNRLSDFSMGPDGWLAMNLRGDLTSECDGKTVLGGHAVAVKNAVLQKTWTGLPTHAAVQVSLVLDVLGNWGGATISVLLDNKVYFVEGYQSRDHPYNGVCKYRVNSVPVTFVAPHTALDATVKLTTTVNGDPNLQGFGIRDFQIQSLASLPTLAGSGVGAWSAVATDFGTAGANNWAGIDLRVLACSSLGMSLFSFGAAATGAEPRMVKTFTGLPAHNNLRITVQYTFQHIGAAVPTGVLRVDGALVAQRKQAASGQCDVNVWAIDLELVHSGANATLEFDLVGAGSAAAGSNGLFGITGLQIAPFTAGSEPWPAANVTSVKSDFTMGVDGWLTNAQAEQRSNCGVDVLGGLGVNGRGGVLSKTYTGLPPHQALSLAMDLHLFGSWEREQVSVVVDGVTVWSRVRHSGEFVYNAVCAVGELVEPVSILLDTHTSPTVTIQIINNLNSADLRNEALGVSDVALEVIPALPPATGTGTGAFNGQIQGFEAVGDGQDGWRGLGVQRTFCAGKYNFVLGVSGVSGAQASITKKFTTLPIHNNVRVRLDLLFTSRAGKVTAEIDVDGQGVFLLTRTVTAYPSVCSTASNIPIDMYIAHSTGDVEVTVRLIGAYDLVGSFGVFAVDNVLVTAPVLGTANWVNRKSDFSRGPDDWLTTGVGTQVTQCAQIGYMLGGFNTLGLGDSVVKTYQRLDTATRSHNGLIISLNVIFLAGWVGERIVVTADGATIWEKRHNQNEGAVFNADCQTNIFVEPVWVYLPGHVSPDVTLKVVAQVGSNQNSNAAFGLQDIQVTLVAPCIDGRYMTAPPTESNPTRSCGACQVCPASQVELVACTHTTNRQCGVCPGPTCAAGTFESGPCSATTGRACSPCTPCLADEYLTTACSASADAVCAACPTCAAGQYQAGTCDPASTVPPTCQACNPTCATCDSATTCKTCKAGLSLSSTTGLCVASCPAGEYRDPISSLCLTCDAGCATCTGAGANACASCSGGTFLDGSECVADCAAVGKFGAGGECRACSQCQPGSFQIAACTGAADTLCTPCTTGFTDRAGLTACKTPTTCTEGNFMAAQFTPSSDRVCAVCAPNTFSNSLNAPSCTPCTACGGAAPVVDTPCTPTQGTTCTVCKTCQLTEYVDTPCTGSLNTVCVPCVTRESCGTNQFFMGTCVSTALSGPSCQTCPSACATCTGPLATDCTSCKAPFRLINGVCSNANCPAGQYLDATTSACLACAAGCTACTAVDACQTCAAGSLLYNGACVASCPASTYQSGTSCLDCTVCQAGTKISVPCSGAANTVCAACTAGSEFQDQPGQFACKPLTPCLAGTGIPIGQAPNATHDTTCTACDVGTHQNSQAVASCVACTPCTPTLQHEVLACAADRDRTCTACATCTANQFQSGGCTDGGPLDRTCTPCTSCGAGNYPSTPCSATADNVCALCHSSCATCAGPLATECTSCSGTAFQPNSVGSATGTCVGGCGGGFYFDAALKTCLACSATCTACTGPSATECTVCPAGKKIYNGQCLDHCQSAVPPAHSGPGNTCVACVTCQAGQYRQRFCTENSDTVCASCAVNTFSTTTDAASCTPTTKCRLGSVVDLTVAVRPPLADATCRTCGTNEFADQASVDARASACTPASQCKAGLYEVHPTTTSTDRQCAFCRNCPRGSYKAPGGCTGTLDSSCTVCPTTCRSNEYLDVQDGCDNVNVVLKPPICRSCQTSCKTCAGNGNDQCLSCAAGQVLVPSSPGASTGSCTTACPAGQYLSGGICQPCNPSCFECSGPTSQKCTSCFNRAEGFSTGPNGGPFTYLLDQGAGSGTCMQQCNGGFANEITGKCEDCQPCPAGTRTRVPCSGGAQSVCDPCDGQLEFQNDPGQSSCKTARVCIAGTFVRTKPTASTDRECDPCAAGTFTAGSNLERCQAWTGGCNPGQYIVASATASSNIRCASVTNCGLNSFETDPPGLSSDRVCQAWQRCSPNVAYASSPGTATSDVVCSPVSVCGAATVSSQDPTSSSDRVCTYPVRIAFAEDYSTTIPTPLDKGLFEDSVATFLKGRGVDPFSVDIQAGSIVATIQARSEPDANRIRSLADDGLLIVSYNGASLQASVLDDSSTSRGGSDSSDDGTTTVAIVIGVIAVLVVMGLLVFVAVMLKHRKKNRSAARRSVNVSSYDNPMYQGAGSERKGGSFVNPVYEVSDEPEQMEGSGYLDVGAAVPDDGYLDVTGAVGGGDVGYMDVGGDQSDAGYMDVGAPSQA